jgi:hypothetical protein
MAIYLLTFKLQSIDQKHGFTDWEDAVRKTLTGELYHDSWRVKCRGIRVGDEIYVLKQGVPPTGVVAHGRVVRGSYDHFKSRDGSGGTSQRVDVEFDTVLSRRETPLPWPLHPHPGKFKGPFGSGMPLATDLTDEMNRRWEDWVSHR